MNDELKNPHPKGGCKSMRWFLTTKMDVMSTTEAKRLRKPQLKEACVKVLEANTPPAILRIVAKHEQCDACDGTGDYLKGKGICWRCKGKGYRDGKDNERNAKYDAKWGTR